MLLNKLGCGVDIEDIFSKFYKDNQIFLIDVIRSYKSEKTN